MWALKLARIGLIMRARHWAYNRFSLAREPLYSRDPGIVVKGIAEGDAIAHTRQGTFLVFQGVLTSSTAQSGFLRRSIAQSGFLRQSTAQQVAQQVAFLPTTHSALIPLTLLTNSLVDQCTLQPFLWASKLEGSNKIPERSPKIQRTTCRVVIGQPSHRPQFPKLLNTPKVAQKWVSGGMEKVTQK